MYFREHGMDFREADRRYAELKRQLDAGSISAKEFDAQRLRLMVKDDEGRWWAKGRKEGEWSYRAEGGWIRGTPPGYQPPSRTSPADGTQEHHAPQSGQNEPSTLSFSGSQAQDERSPASQNVADRRGPALQATPPASSSTRDRGGGERRPRGRSGNRAGISIGLGVVGVLLAVGLLAGIAVASGMGIIGGEQEAGSGMKAPSLPSAQSEPEAESQPDTKPPVAAPAPTKSSKSPTGGDSKPDPPTETRQSSAPSPSKPDTKPPVATPAPAKGGGTGDSGGGNGGGGGNSGEGGGGRDPGPDSGPDPAPDLAPDPGPDPAPDPGPDPAPDPAPDPDPNPGKDKGYPTDPGNKGGDPTDPGNKGGDPTEPGKKAGDATEPEGS